MPNKRLNFADAGSRRRLHPLGDCQFRRSLRGQSPQRSRIPCSGLPRTTGTTCGALTRYTLKYIFARGTQTAGLPWLVSWRP